MSLEAAILAQVSSPRTPSRTRRVIISKDGSVPGTVTSWTCPTGVTNVRGYLVGPGGTGVGTALPTAASGYFAGGGSGSVTPFSRTVVPGTTYSFDSSFGQTWAASNLTGNTSNNNSNALPAFAADSAGHCVAAFYNGTNYAVYYSSNYGQTWTASNLSGAAATTYVNCTPVVVALDSAGHFLVNFYNGSIYGVYYSTNYGQTWTTGLAGSIATSTNNSLTALAALDTAGHCVASWYNGTTYTVYYSSNYGQNWTASNLSNSATAAGKNGTPTFAALDTSGHCITSFYNGTNYAVYYSSNYGQTWTASNLTTTGSISNVCGIPAMAALDSSGHCVVAWGFTVYYSSNYGQTWTASNLTTGSSTTYVNGTPVVVALDTSGHCAASFYMGSNYAVYYSSNYGQTWTASNLTSTTSTGAANATPEIAALDASGHCVAAFYDGTNCAVYYSSNYGQTWTASNLTTGSSMSYMNAIPVITPIDSLGHCLISYTNGTNYAVYTVDSTGFGGLTYQAGGNAVGTSNATLVPGLGGSPGGGDGGMRSGYYGSYNMALDAQASIFDITRGGSPNRVGAGTWIGEGGSGAFAGGPAGIIIEWDEVAS